MPYGLHHKKKELTTVILTKCLFGSVVAVAFQSAYRAEIYQNDIFLFFKNHF